VSQEASPRGNARTLGAAVAARAEKVRERFLETLESWPAG